MQYLLFPFILLFYFEMLGRWIMYKFNKEPMTFSFVIGFLALMAIYYIFAWPITAFNGPFNYIVIFTIVLIFLSILMIIKDFKKILFKFNCKLWILLVIFLAFEIIISWNRSLGDPHGFDVLYYLNMISFNIGNDAMNTLHPHFGTFPNTDVQWITYVFQSFYYFIPAIIFIFRNLFSIIGMSFETLPAYVWGFQIIAHAIFIAVSLLCVIEINFNNKILKYSSIILLILFMGNFYYNNSFGFIGNNLRMSIHALSIIFLIKYFNEEKKEYLYLVYIAMLGMCAVSSTGTFSFVFLLFGLFFVIYKDEKYLLKEYAIVLFVPLLNIVVTKIGANFIAISIVLVLCSVVYFLNDIILKIYQNKYIRYGTLFLIFLVLYIGSILVTHKLIDISKFINNYSEFQDMSWDYFWFYDLRHWIFNLIVLIPFGYFIFKNKKHPLSTISFVLIITFFNPLTSGFINKINWVYYRSYDIIINQFTIIFFISYLINHINSKKINKLLSCIMLVSSIVLSIIQIPRYHHESFIPGDDYNPIYKIDNSELEVINNVRKLIIDKKIENPAIITSTFWMPSFIEDSTYLIGKERRYDYNAYDDNSYGLYLIFFPTDGWDNFRPTDKPDYDHVIELLKESNYDILVVDYGLYAEYKGEFISLADAVESDGTYQRSEYSTSKYAVFYLGDEK